MPISGILLLNVVYISGSDVVLSETIIIINSKYLVY